MISLLRGTIFGFIAISGLVLLTAFNAALAADKPNILVIMGDDIGIPNISHYSFGMMGYKTPNIDRIAQQGALFTRIDDLPWLIRRMSF